MRLFLTPQCCNLPLLELVFKAPESAPNLRPTPAVRRCLRARRPNGTGTRRRRTGTPSASTRSPSCGSTSTRACCGGRRRARRWRRTSCLWTCSTWASSPSTAIWPSSTLPARCCCGSALASSSAGRFGRTTRLLSVGLSLVRLWFFLVLSASPVRAFSLFWQ